MMIPRRAYVDADIFKDEMECLFGRRFFVGTDWDFAEEGSYCSFQLGKHALTCRRDGGPIKVFNNVCLHRNALIDPPGSGKRDFRCGYHGWRYDGEGKLSHAPFVDSKKVPHRCLQQFPVASAEGMHFMGLQEQTPDISEVHALMERLDFQMLAAPFDAGRLVHDCNWKLLVENVLEAYHVSIVHKSTFVPMGGNVADYDVTGAGRYTTWEFVWPKVPEKASLISKLPGASLQHLHGYVFPNLFLATTNKLVGYVGQVLPVSANRSILDWQLFALPALLALPAGVRDLICSDASKMHREVLLEDKPLLEYCQQGLASEGIDYQLQPQESQIEFFHRMWQECLSPKG